MEFQGKVVVITGASTGLGLGMAEWFHGNGALVGMCARRTPADLGTGSVVKSVDVTDLAALGAFAEEVGEKLGPIDLWINNAAALGPITPQRDLPIEELEDHFRVNVGGVLFGTQAYLAQLEKSGHQGSLVNISSGLGKRGMAGVSAYSAAKAAVDRLTETVGLEEPDLLRMVLAVSPGIVETGMQEALRSQDASVLHDVEMFRDKKTDNEMNSPAWVAQAIAGWVFGDVDPGGVLVRVEQEPH